MLDLVGNPEDRFSCVAAQVVFLSLSTYSSMMSEMVQANSSSPSGNCKATRLAPAVLILHIVL